jgi:hypothetical protein
MGTADPYNTTNTPLRILNIDARGKLSIFCPAPVAATSEKYEDFVMDNKVQDSLDNLLAHPVFQQVHQEIECGLALCKSTCLSWDYCGVSPSNTFFEHSRFDVAETTTRRVHKQATIDVLIEYIEAKLAVTYAGRSHNHAVDQKHPIHAASHTSVERKKSMQFSVCLFFSPPMRQSASGSVSAVHLHEQDYFHALRFPTETARRGKRC